MSSEYFAHLTEGGVRPPHKLESHLQKVAEKAKQFAISFGNGDWAYLAGLWHDLGKYNPAFQEYLKKAAGEKAEDAHLEDVENAQHTRGPDHSTAGAEHAVQKLGKVGRILAYVIAGHHAGLADWDTNGVMAQGALGVRLNNRGQKCLAQVQHLASPEILNTSTPTTRPPGKDGRALWIRMLFSCLVDADFLDTEQFMDDARSSKRGHYPSLAMMYAQYKAHMETLAKEAEDTPVNRIRAEILERCLEKAREQPGFFSLNVPTGGGKTLASLGFALEHAALHNKQRIIYVIPYTSIIEQTANVFKGIFGQDNVIEHHSQFDPKDAGEEKGRQRLAAENWDAPLIVTTNVQFFESLYAARTSRARKLHNIVNSVVILDEAQLLPPDMLDPVRHAMNELMHHYGVTFVLSTATQPVLDDPPLRQGARQRIIFPQRREIIENPQKLHAALKRVDVIRQCTGEETKRRDWESLAKELAEYKRALCIVNRRDDCRQLHALMPRGTVHLSALMCGEHRSKVIEKIKQDLRQDGIPVRVISTQLVEAGVDMDFPVVYRAMAGLDSIAQAAGRCNREGKLDKGKMVIFTPPKDAPPGLLRRAENAGKFVLRSLNDDDDPLQPEYFERYFREFYGSVESAGGYDKKRVLDCLKANPEWKFSFRTAAQNFRMIEDAYLPVIVHYEEGQNIIRGLHSGWLDRRILRKAQRYSVSIPPLLHGELLSNGDIEEIHDMPGVYVQKTEKLYDPVLGFSPEHIAEYGAADLIVGSNYLST